MVLAGVPAQAAMVAYAGLASAQPTSPPDGVAVGDFWFRPRVELRVRGEYHHDAVARSPAGIPILGSQLGAPSRIAHQWVAHERARLGLEVERGVLTAVVVVQDARVAGFSTVLGGGGADDRATTSFHAAYLEARSREWRPSFVRLGRQEIAWGEGRLLGISDWFLRPRALDAVRARFTSRLLDVEALATILSPPGSIPAEYERQVGGAAGLGSGAQLYGLLGTIHLDPLLHGEVMGLARVARAPLLPLLAPSDTYVIDGRVFGERGGLGYAAEFAYELGRLAVPGGRRLSAWAATAHVDWQSSLMFRPKLVLGSSYATGDDGSASGTMHTFDPILPDARSGLGQMGLYAWSNIFDGSFTITATPLEEIGVTLAYRYVRLAHAKGTWFAANLAPVGQNIANESAFLGHELDAVVRYSPVDVLTLRAGYGAMLTGDGARTILSGRPDGGPRLLSTAFVEVRLALP